MTRVLGLWGSGEFLPWAREPDRFLLDHARRGSGTALVLPTASAPEGDGTFRRWGTMGLDHYASMDVPARLVELRTRDDAHDDAIVAELDDASLVYFSGGNPAYLANTLRDTPFWTRLLTLLDEGLAVAGCSAGACIMGEQAPDPARMDTIDAVFATRGLAIVKGHVFGAHWDQIDTYYPNLRQISIRMLPDACTMVGIDEDTAMTTSDGERWRVWGKGGVHVYSTSNGSQPLTYTAEQTLTLP